MFLPSFTFGVKRVSSFQNKDGSGLGREIGMGPGHYEGLPHEKRRSMWEYVTNSGRVLNNTLYIFI
jgi:hypothetical protein